MKRSKVMNWLLVTLPTLTLVGSANAALLGHLTFDDPRALGADSSGRGNNATTVNAVVFEAGGVAGGHARFGARTHSYIDWKGRANPIANVLAHDFTFSLLLRTTQTFSNDGAFGFEGAGIVYADVPSQHHDSVPMALTGSKLAFNTGSNFDSTLHSRSSINTGDFVHLAVTWVQSTGLKSIYVNGKLDAQEHHGAGYDLSARNQLVLGGNLTDVRYFDGLIDDFQVYDRALAATDVAFLAANPGMTTPIPEPRVCAMLLAGLSVIGWVARHRPR